MLFDHGNPYAGGDPDILRLGWDDFSCGVSALNAQALGRMAEWTVLAYLAADCDLSELMFGNLLELKAAGSSADVHVLALFDGPLLTDSFFARLNPGTPLGEDILLRFNELRTNEAATITLALRLAGAFPARRRLIILGGHGNGWRGLLLDENRGLRNFHKTGRLALPGPGAECDARLHADVVKVQARLNDVIGALPSPSGRADVMAIDACLMGSIETAARLSGFAEYLVVSQDTMPGQGLAYGGAMSRVHADPGQRGATLAADLLCSTKDFYSERPETGPVTLSVLRADKLPAFSAAFVRLVQLLDPSGEPDFAAVRQAMENARRFGLTGTLDLKGFVLHIMAFSLKPLVIEAARGVLRDWDEMIVATTAPGGAGEANGLSIYAPPPRAFEVAYIDEANGLPFALGIWALLLGGIYLRWLAEDWQEHPLLRSIGDSMERLVAQGVYKP